MRTSLLSCPAGVEAIAGMRKQFGVGNAVVAATVHHQDDVRASKNCRLVGQVLVAGKAIDGVDRRRPS